MTAGVRDVERAGEPAADRVRPPAVPALLAAAGIATALGALRIDTLTSAAQRAEAHADPGTSTALVGALLMGTAAVLLAARPKHAIGVVLAVFGSIWALDGLLESWAAYSLGRDLPGTSFAFWFVQRFGAYLLLALPLLLVLYPTGRLMPGRWGRISLGIVATAAVLPTLLILVPDDAAFVDQPLPAGVRTDRFALPLSQDAAVGALTVASPLTLLALLAALVVLCARYRMSNDLERTQIRWLLWAGVVCALSALLLLVVPAGTLAGAVVGAAVVFTAISATIGVLRPHLTDVDALVAGTLTYAAVAAVVVATDLAAVAAASALLGDRLKERDVTILVLLLAVGVYGPLRDRLGAAVRRLLFGRRGDRYGVVSSLAARLEDTGGVEEQLPALAAAVASTFKVPFVRVEVYRPDGGAVSASHGLPTDDTQVLAINYRNEQVGSLILPRRGFGSMLSRRDQGLLIDLVRQAAVAIRASLLSVALQESRERLVLAREEDRRRIRRDLHDGLGPVLGGVTLRLDAAGNAVDADPARARELVRLARTEVREALDDVRRLVHGLRPPALDDVGLLAALEHQAEGARSRLDVTVTAADLGSLPAAVEVAAYRIVSEALTNVVKHADASTVRIRLAVVGTAIEVEVRDDGRGIAKDVRAGVGLLSLRERAEELGGRCEVTCPAEGGTRVWAWLPLVEGRLVP